MKMSPLCPCSKPCSRWIHNETVINLALFSSIINGITKESRLRISIPWECFNSSIESKIVSHLHLYTVDLLEVQESCRALRSNKENRLKLPMTRTKTLGTRAFTYAAPAVWNSLPVDIRNTKCIKAFKILLKTHYFEIAYN